MSLKERQSQIPRRVEADRYLPSSADLKQIGSMPTMFATPGVSDLWSKDIQQWLCQKLEPDAPCSMCMTQGSAPGGYFLM